MKSIRERIYLAALLHDIGKFYQRADTGSVSESCFLKNYCKEESTFCPQTVNGKYSHKHVLWTAQFIEDFNEVFNRLVTVEGDVPVNENLINLSAGHHLKTDQLSEFGRIIKEADSLSSGMDRSCDEAFKDVQDEMESSWDSFKKKRMISILQTIKTNKEASQDVWQHLPVGKVNLNKNSFPKESFENVPDYKELWNEFINEFKFIQANTYRAFSETFLNLLYKYTTSIPSSTINFPDVSLYDHLKTTASIAVCLYDYKNTERENDKPFLLIGADFSGIQSYIYQIVSKYAGKNLKGRSFYLRILSDTIVRYILKELNLFHANVVYNSGGGFYILAPNTRFVKERLKACISFIEKQLFKTHGTMLYVSIDSVEMSKNALMNKGDEGLDKVWSELFEKRDKKKSSKYTSLFKEDYQSFFTPIMRGGDAKRDSITGEEIVEGEASKEKDGLVLKPITSCQIEIGKKLRETNLLVVKEGEPLSYWNNRVHVSPANLGFTYYFLDSHEELKRMKEQLSASADEVTVITMNGADGNCDFLHSLDGINNIYALDFYGGNEINQKTLRTFEEMCDDTNLSRLGVLRMDVDNLGKIFKEGLPNGRATLSRYAALSRSFDYFFSGYLNTIWNEVDPNNSFIIYSGGDDVFIVARWDVAIALAKRIRTDFAEFTCQNPNFTISCGISIIPPKYPIMKGAEESAKEENKAKNHTCVNTSKNSISFMGMPMDFYKEFPVVEDLKDQLTNLLSTNRLPKSFISKIMTHFTNADITHHEIKNYKTYWMLTYDLNRMMGRYRADSDIVSIIKNCINEVCCNDRRKLNAHSIETDYHPLELWAFASRWAELEYRNTKE